MRNIKNKKISIVGAARSGLAAARLAKKFGAKPFVSDAGDERKFTEAIKTLRKEGIPFEFNGHTSRVFDCDLLVVSPGVPDDSDVMATARSKGIETISELEFASCFVSSKIVAITGTNGKTTTTALCSYLLNFAGIKTATAGNIGVALSDVVLSSEKYEAIALEVSSFQLDHIKEFKPYVSAIINITPDHLNRYENSFGKYIAAKARIFENQGKDDYLIINLDDRNIPSVSADVQQFGISLENEVGKGAYYSKGVLFFANASKVEAVAEWSKCNLQGEHNIYNSLVALTVGKIFGISNRSIQEAFSTFKGVEHRLEFVKEINGIKFVNDSKATNVDAVWYAIRSFDEPLFLILGGQDKGNDYSRLDGEVKKRVKKIYAIGSSAKKVYEHFHEIVETEIKDSLEACVQAALKEANAGTVTLLSPACASFDMFKNYEHRGKAFKEIVNGVQE